MSHISFSSLATCRSFCENRSHMRTSVANAVVYPPNWATLKSPAMGQKSVRRVAKHWVTFHPSTRSSSLFFKFASFLSIQSFHQFQGLRRPGAQSISIIQKKKKKKKFICCSLVLWSFDNTDEGQCVTSLGKALLIASPDTCVNCLGYSHREVNKNNLLAGQLIIFLPKNWGK